MNSVEENLQKYQLIQDNIIYILSTSLVGVNLKLSCYKFEGTNNTNQIYSSIFTIQQLKGADPIFEIANDCEDVQWIFEEVILAKSVGILEYNGFLDVYFYMRVSGRKAKVILRLNGTNPPKMMLTPNMNNNIMNSNVMNSNVMNSKAMNNTANINNYQINQERLSKLQNDANQLINEQNALRKQLSIFFGEDENMKDIHERSRSTNQNNRYHNQLNNYNNFSNINNGMNNNMVNLKRIQINDDEDNDIYEVPPMNDNEL